METVYPEQYSDMFTLCEYLLSIPGHNGNVENFFIDENTVVG
jgi:hypothetical protein